MVGAVGGGGGGLSRALKVMSIVRTTLLTIAVTRTRPAAPVVSVTVATPFVVVLMTLSPPPLRAPALVENSTAVPFGTGWLLSVTVAVIVTLESTSGFVFVAVSTRLTPVGGGEPPGGDPPGGGAVGDSPLHAANRSR